LGTYLWTLVPRGCAYRLSKSISGRVDGGRDKFNFYKFGSMRCVPPSVLPAVHPVRVVGPSRSSLSGLNPALGTPRARAAPRREINMIAMPGPENTRSCTVTRRDSCRVLWPMPHALSTHTACCVARAPRASALRTHSCDHLPVAPTLAHSFLKPRCRSAGSKQPSLDVYVAWRSGRTFSPW